MAFMLSAVLVALGLLAFVQIERGKANLGVDFAGSVSENLLSPLIA